jgi:hypothetical protein
LTTSGIGGGPGIERPPGGCRNTLGPGINYDTLTIENIESTQDMNYDLDPDTMKVHITRTINYSAQVQVNSQPTTMRDAMRVDSFVDLTKYPPVCAQTALSRVVCATPIPMARFSRSVPLIVSWTAVCWGG